jgi:8-oxo-dGTP pyrophosphatase MutT (NUDIX family)
MVAAARRMLVLPSSMPSKPKAMRRQYGALPFRVGADGKISIMLVTTRGTGRWIVPKGWPIANLRPRDVAAREAYEEAGLVGEMLGKKAVGRFTYEKSGGGHARRCEVKLFAMRIHHQLPDWPERVQRETRWFAPEAAAAVVEEAALASLLLALNGSRPERTRPRARRIDFPAASEAACHIANRRQFHAPPHYRPAASRHRRATRRLRCRRAGPPRLVLLSPSPVLIPRFLSRMVRC